MGPISRLALTLLIGGALAFPAGAAADWSAPVTISGAGEQGFSSQVAVDRKGNSVFIWAANVGGTGCGGFGCSRVKARVRTNSGVLTPIQTLSDPSRFLQDPQVGVDRRGNAVFAWLRRDGTTGCGGFPGCNRVQARVRAVDGSLGPVETLSDFGENVLTAHLAVAANGNAAFTWWSLGCTETGGCNHVQGRVRSATGDLTAVETLSAGDAIVPRVGIDESGNAIFTWQATDGTTACNGAGCNQIQARVRLASGALSAIQTLSNAGEHADSPEIGVDQNGTAVFSWIRQDNSTACGGQGCFRVQTRSRTPAGELSPVQTLSEAGKDAGNQHLAVESDGDAVYVWQRQEPGTTGCGGNGCYRIQTRARKAAGTLSAVQTLSIPGQDAVDPDVAVDESGTAVFGWSRDDNCGGDPGCIHLQSRTRASNGILGALQSLSAPGDFTSEARVAMSPHGDATAAWTDSPGGDFFVGASFGP
jgi:hypothetical protein